MSRSSIAILNALHLALTALSTVRPRPDESTIKVAHTMFALARHSLGELQPRDLLHGTVRELPPSQTLSHNASHMAHRLTGILVGRFLLHLQAANRKALDLQSSIHSEAHGTATLVFARAVGSLVSSLGPEEDTEYSGDTGDSLIGGSTNVSE